MGCKAALPAKEFCALCDEPEHNFQFWDGILNFKVEPGVVLQWVPMWSRFGLRVGWQPTYWSLPDNSPGWSWSPASQIQIQIRTQMQIHTIQTPQWLHLLKCLHSASGIFRCDSSCSGGYCHQLWYRNSSNTWLELFFSDFWDQKYTSKMGVNKTNTQNKTCKPRMITCRKNEVQL